MPEFRKATDYFPDRQAREIKTRQPLRQFFQNIVKYTHPGLPVLQSCWLKMKVNVDEKENAKWIQSLTEDTFVKQICLKSASTSWTDELRMERLRKADCGPKMKGWPWPQDERLTEAPRWKADCGPKMKGWPRPQNDCRIVSKTANCAPGSQTTSTGMPWRGKTWSKIEESLGIDTKWVMLLNWSTTDKITATETERRTGNKAQRVVQPRVMRNRKWLKTR